MSQAPSGRTNALTHPSGQVGHSEDCSGVSPASRALLPSAVPMVLPGILSQISSGPESPVPGSDSGEPSPRGLVLPVVPGGAPQHGSWDPVTYLPGGPKAYLLALACSSRFCKGLI